MRPVTSAEVHERNILKVRDCFEGASATLPAELPGYPTGTCYSGGVSLAMGVKVAVPLAVA